MLRPTRTAVRLVITRMAIITPQLGAQEVTYEHYLEYSSMENRRLTGCQLFWGNSRHPGG